MIWVCILLVAAVALAPFGWSVWHGGRVRGRRDAAIALHRAQLAELDRDLAEGRLLAAEHEAARLEVQRRLLAEADRTEAETARSGPLGVALTAALVPAVALVLYLADGMPDYAAHRAAAGQQISDAKRNQELLHDEELVARLRATLAKLDPHAERTQHGYVMLGNAELELGHLTEAVEAWKVALAGHFDPRLGAETAELITETTGHVTPEAESLFKRALAEAPPKRALAPGGGEARGGSRKVLTPAAPAWQPAVRAEIKFMTDDSDVPSPGDRPPTPAASAKSSPPKEIGGPKGPEPTRYGDWEVKGRCSDF